MLSDTTRAEDDDDVPMTTHGDSSADPGEEKYTDPLIGEGSGEEQATDLG